MLLDDKTKVNVFPAPCFLPAKTKVHILLFDKLYTVSCESVGNMCNAFSH